ncbi:MAG: peptide chain release factor 1 [bacterium]|nr:peptide chain release factor 1 [bacterium]
MEELTIEIREHILSISARIEELNQLLVQPEILSDSKKLKEYSKERVRLQPIVEKYFQIVELEKQLNDAIQLFTEENDPELKDLALQEQERIRNELKRLWDELKPLLAPPDMDDDRDAILEIRAGTGGEEAALFAADLLRMYQRYCERKRFKWEPLSISESGVGGIKEAIVAISGESVYGTLKYESGVHRVQRVPITEASGRIHTSAASVAVLPQAEEIDIVIDEKDLRIDTYRSSGAGGQHVNMTDSAVRITHIPTDIVVTCSDERSQIKNRARAMQILRTKLYDRALQEKHAKTAAARKEMVSTGDRSAKIRTYNFPQNRITDHRINLTVYNLSDFLDGDLDEMIAALSLADRSERLAQVVKATNS